MTEYSKDGSNLAAKFQDFRAGNDGTANFGDFTDVSNSFVEAYASLLKAGLPRDSIAFAMLGATLNFYDIFGLREELPCLLRELAEEIEQNPVVN